MSIRRRSHLETELLLRNSVSRLTLLVVLVLLAVLAAACNRLPAPAADPGVDLGDPDVGGGAGQDTGPQTPIPTATATGEASPRLDATAAAAFPTGEATAESTADSRPPTAEPVPATPEASSTTEAMPTSAQPSPEPPTATPEPPTPAVSPSATPPTNAAGETIHVVQAGENLYRIGLQYGLSWVVIAEFNGITDPNAITVGQELRIPPAPTATPEAQSIAPTADDRPPTAAGEPTQAADAFAAVSGQPSAVVPGGQPSTVVIVAAGDTLYTLAQRHGVTWDQVAEANGLTAPNQIYAGQQLKIPADAPGPTPDFTHQVHRGETLSGIARQYGLSPADLAAANGLSEPYTIYPGQALVIPGE